MKPRLLLFQHVDYCPPGTFGDFLATDGIAPTVVDFSVGAEIPHLEDFDILIVLGGPMDVWQEDAHPWLIREKAAIRRWVEELDKPYLGVCLGHQLLADSIGGNVGPADTPEVGLLDIGLNDWGQGHPLFQGFGTSKRAVQWHYAEVKALPHHARVLASTSACPVTAFTVGSAAFGIQYHVEATDDLVGQWSAEAPSSALLERLHGSGAATRLLAEVGQAMPELRSNAQRIYDNFMRIARDRRTPGSGRPIGESPSGV